MSEPVPAPPKAPSGNDVPAPAAQNVVPPPAARQKDRFGVQAAKFALYAPIVSLAIGIGANVVLTNSPGSPPNASTGYAWMGIAGLNIFLNVAAFIAGIAAIAAIFVQKLKPLGILIRSIVGMALAGLILGSVVVIFTLPRRLVENTTNRVTGEWKATIHPSGGAWIESHLTLRADHQATMHMIRDTSMEPGIHLGNDTIERSMDGEWRVVAGRTMSDRPRLIVRWKPGQDPQAGEGIGWVIRDVGENTMALEAAGPGGNISTEYYERVRK